MMLFNIYIRWYNDIYWNMNLLVIFSIFLILYLLIDSYVIEFELEEFVKWISFYKVDYGCFRVKRKFFGKVFCIKEVIKKVFEEEF